MFLVVTIFFMSNANIFANLLGFALYFLGLDFCVVVCESYFESPKVW
jgi:hypothetical protein